MKVGAAAAVLSAPRPLLARLGSVDEPLPPIEDPRLRGLALRALDVARDGGAEYADIRLTHTRERTFSRFEVYDEESMEVGVRALVDGYWGFASGPVWSPDEMARLGRDAVYQAKTSAVDAPRAVSLAAVAMVKSGHWEMPVELDPFEISPFEVQDFLNSLQSYTKRVPNTRVKRNSAVCTVQAKAFASTVGSYCTQRCYRTQGKFLVAMKLERDGREGQFSLDCLTPAGMGWELYAAERIPRVREHSMREEVRQRLEECREDLMLPLKPVNVGRYDAVVDAWTMTNLVDETLGRATELDRALGYEANAGGTSYLNDPMGMLGSYEVGAPVLTVTADRSEPGAVATVKWDDEGVTADDFALVKDGVLTDFQTTRESAGWLTDAYAKLGRPIRSHGCAGAPSAVYAPMQHAPNLTVAPGQGGRDFDALVTGLGKGIAIKGAQLNMDFQHSSGLGLGSVFEVRQGKRVARIVSAGFLFRATELLKALQDIGGGPSLRRYGRVTVKGEPAQGAYHSVTAAPAVVKELTLIDPLRKA